MAMEIHFEQSQLSAAAKPAKIMKSRGRGSHQAGGGGGKFVGVRQRPSGRWVAEIKDTTQKIRMWLGTFETAEAAARAYDEAACLLRGSNTRTNFLVPRGGGAAVASNSPIAARIRGLLHHRKLAKGAPAPAPPQPPPPSTIVPAASSATTSVAASSHSSSLSSSSSPSSRTATATIGCDHTSLNARNPIRTTTTTTAARRQAAISHISENQTTETAVPDHVYRPSFGNGNSEVLHLGASSSSSSDFSWLFDSAGIERLPAFTLQEEGPPLELPSRHGVVFEEGGELGMSELERMKVERQISASLYAINGVHEYLEAVHDPSSSDVALWDLPPLCQLFCHA